MNDPPLAVTNGPGEALFSCLITVREGTAAMAKAAERTATSQSDIASIVEQWQEEGRRDSHVKFHVYITQSVPLQQLTKPSATGLDLDIRYDVPSDKAVTNKEPILCCEAHSHRLSRVWWSNNTLVNFRDTVYFVVTLVIGLRGSEGVARWEIIRKLAPRMAGNDIFGARVFGLFI